MRPVSGQFQITQGFASLPTEGVAGDMQGSMVQVLVAMYGNYQPDGHAGTDIGCPVGTPVRAARSGTVIYCNWDVNLPGGPNDWSSRWFFYQRFGGRLLLVQHAPNDIDVYAHLSDWKVRQGQFVNEGEVIALSGDSSAGLDGQLGPHLHTERIVNTSYPTGGGLIYGRTDPTTVWGGIAAQAGTITPLSEEDELSQAEVDQLWKLMDTRAAQVQEAVIKKLDQVASGIPLGVWAYTNPALGGGDAFQHVRDAVANTQGLAAELAAVAAREATAGASVDQITAAVLDAIEKATVKVDVTVNGGK